MGSVEDSPLVLCPRCEREYYVPYGTPGPWPVGFFPPALSRTDNETYICSACGTDEAMLDHMGKPPIPPYEWPIPAPGFGQGYRQKGDIEWPGLE